MITIEVNNQAEPWINRILNETRNPRQILLAAGRAVANLLRKHYTKLNELHPNKLGGKRTNFWLQIKRSVNAPVMEGPKTVRVSIAHPAIEQKVKGGTIRAKRVKFLTIPVSPEAYGRTASTLEHQLKIKLIPIMTAGAGVLASYKSGQGGKPQLTVHYVLKRAVTQEPDPKALPTISEITYAAKAAMEMALDIQLRRY